VTGSTWHLSATPLPGGDSLRELWITDGRISFNPIADAEELVPAGGFVLPGLVDAHSHPSMDFSTARAFLGEPALDDGAPADLVTYAVDPRNEPEVLRSPTSIVFGGQRIA
jgi:imidazolonepropionase-like amidohydrolase